MSQKLGLIRTLCPFLPWFVSTGAAQGRHPEALGWAQPGSCTQDFHSRFASLEKRLQNISPHHHHTWPWHPFLTLTLQKSIQACKITEVHDQRTHCGRSWTVKWLLGKQGCFLFLSLVCSGLAFPQCSSTHKDMESSNKALPSLSFLQGFSVLDQRSSIKTESWICLKHLISPRF